MRHGLILISTMILILAGAAGGSVHKGEVEIEVLGGLSMESGADQGDDQDAILLGAVGADMDSWFVQGGIGWFLSDYFQVGIAGFGTWMDGSETARLTIDPAFPETVRVYDADVDATFYGVGGRARLHFGPTKRLVPFVGGQVYWTTGDIDVSGTASIVTDGVTVPGSEAEFSESDSPSGILYGPIVGLRAELGDRDEIVFEYAYHLWTGDIGDVLESGHAVSLGWSHRLK